MLDPSFFSTRTSPSPKRPEKFHPSFWLRTTWPFFSRPFTPWSMLGNPKRQWKAAAIAALRMGYLNWLATWALATKSMFWTLDPFFWGLFCMATFLCHLCCSFSHTRTADREQTLQTHPRDAIHPELCPPLHPKGAPHRAALFPSAHGQESPGAIELWGTICTLSGQLESFKSFERGFKFHKSTSNQTLEANGYSTH